MLLEKSERGERENGLEAPKGARRTPKCPPPDLLAREMWKRKQLTFEKAAGAASSELYPQGRVNF